MQVIDFYCVNQDGCIQHYTNNGIHQHYLQPHTQLYNQVINSISSSPKFYFHSQYQHLMSSIQTQLNQCSFALTINLGPVKYLIDVQLYQSIYHQIANHITLYNDILVSILIYLTSYIESSTHPLNHHQQRINLLKNIVNLCQLNIHFYGILVKSRINSMTGNQYQEQLEHVINQIDMVNSHETISLLNQFQSNIYHQLNKLHYFQHTIINKSIGYIHFDSSQKLTLIYSQNLHPSLIHQIKTTYNHHSIYLSQIWQQTNSILQYINKQPFNPIHYIKINDHIRLKVYLHQSNHINAIQAYIQPIHPKPINILNNIQNQYTMQSNLLGSKSLVKKLKSYNDLINNHNWVNVILHQRNSTKSKNNTQATKTPSSTIAQHQLKNKKTKHNYHHKNIIKIDINSPSFDILLISKKNLESIVFEIMKQNVFFKSQIIPKLQQQFNNFVKQLHINYELKSNPYHNFYHGITVLQTTYLITKMKFFNQNLNDFEKFTILFSSLCHDVGHNGFSNQFQINTNSQLSQIYNDSSPLENYHCFKTFQILNKQNNNFLKELTRQKYNQFRKNTIQSILSTDNKMHFQLISNFSKIDKSKPIDKTNINILMGIIVHSSDFGGTVKPFEISKKWSDKINEQFINHYQQQERRGLTPNVMMKGLQHQEKRSKNQLNFLNKLVLPLYSMIHTFSDDKNSKIMLDYILENLKTWQKCYQQCIHKNSRKMTLNVRKTVS